MEDGSASAAGTQLAFNRFLELMNSDGAKDLVRRINTCAAFAALFLAVGRWHGFDAAGETWKEKSASHPCNATQMHTHHPNLHTRALHTRKRTAAGS
jgi:hypothetical protein